jgi:hypothetical protein
MTKITLVVAVGLIAAGAIQTAAHEKSHLRHAKIVSVESAGRLRSIQNR